MNNRNHVMSFATVAVLCVLSGASRADGDTNVNGDASYAAPLSCAEATKNAWFARQMELTDGDFSPVVQTPAECQRDIIARHETEESK